MDLYIDGVRIDDDFLPTGTLEEAIRDVQKSRCPAGRIVVSFACDGETAEPAQVPVLLQRPAGGFDRLELSTSTPAAVVTDTMDRAGETLGHVEDALQQIAAMLIEGRPDEAMTGLGECTRAWQQIHTAIAQSVALLGINPDQFVVKGGTLTEAMTQPRAALVQVRDALEAQDHVLLADVLQYEFSDAMREWHAVIEHVRGAAKTDS